MRIALAAVVLFVGCKKDHKDDPAQQTPVVAPGSAATPPNDPEFLAMTQNILGYTSSMVPVLASFDGDCKAHVQRMLTLEPMALKISAYADAHPEFDGQMKAWMMAHRTEVGMKMEQAVIATKLSKLELGKKEADIKAKCASDPAFQDAMNRIGVMKKKS